MFDLYPHQQEAIQELRMGLSRGHTSQVLGMATGSGKTVVASHIAASAAKKGKRVLFVVDRIELVSQAVQHFVVMGLKIGILRGEDTSYSDDDEIVVASIQTIRSRSAPDWIDVVIIDECHIIHKAHIDLMESWDKVPVIGLSATPLRKGLGKLFSNLVRGPSVRWLTDNGFLVPVRAYAPGAESIQAAIKSVSAGNTPHGYDFDESALGEAMAQKPLIGDIVKTWQEKGENRQTLCFGVKIAHSKSIVENFISEGIPSAHLDAYTKPKERKEIILAFLGRELCILSSVNLLGIGFDVPDASCLILARPTLSESLDMQQKGRGIRTADGKKDCIILDHACNTLRFGLPVHFDLPEKLSDGKEDSRSQNKQAKQIQYVACDNCGHVMEPSVRQCPECGVDRKIRRNDVESVDGELVEYGKESAKNQHSPTEVKTWYLGFRYYIEITKGRSEDNAMKYAYAKTLKKFKRKPVWGWRDLPPIQPSPEQFRWIKSENIRWAKSQRS